MKSIAFFDVDGTLIKGYSGYYTTVELIRRKIIKKRKLPLAIFYKMISSIFYMGDVKKMYQMAIEDMAGSHIDLIMEIGQQIFERDLKPLFYKEALEEIADQKRRGNTIIIISSGPGMAIKSIEKFVGADDSFSIGPVIENNILQNRLDLPIAYKEGKIEVAQREAEKRGLTLKDCTFYADSEHDIHLLSAVGNPRAVNPDRNLKKVAISKCWPILEFKTTLGR